MRTFELLDSPEIRAARRFVYKMDRDLFKLGFPIWALFLLPLRLLCERHSPQPTIPPISE